MNVFLVTVSAIAICYVLDDVADGGLARMKRKMAIAAFSGGGSAAVLLAHARGLIVL